ncbi:MAG: hypothetical protein RIR79_859 [Pseudomonadota bacterium]|jgi:hypothetical protein
MFIKKYIALSFLMVSIFCLIYLSIRFNDYIESNKQGICWTEKRKIPPEEMKVRAIKALVLQQKKEFDDFNDAGIRHLYWAIIKHDLSEDDILKRALTLKGNSAGYVEKEEYDKALDIEEFDSRLHQDTLNQDWFYVDIIDNKFMLTATGTMDMYNYILKLSSYKPYAHINYKKPSLPPLDYLYGVGFYFFEMQNISTNYSKIESKKTTVTNNIYSIDNCGHFVERIGYNFTKHYDNNEIKLQSSVYKYFNPLNDRSYGVLDVLVFFL